MNDNNYNDIEILKIKKKKSNNIECSSIDEKRSSEDLEFKFKNSGKYQNNINLTSNAKINDRKQKKKNTNIAKKSHNHNSFESLKDSLDNISEMIIKQEADILEAVTGCQEPNNYNIYGRLSNGEKIYMFKCREFSSCGMRYFCPVNCRQFTMKIKLAFEENKNTEDEDEEYNNSLIIIDKDCKCPFLCCIRPDMKVILCENNKKLGTIEQKFSICDPVFSIYDKDDNEIFHIEADCFQCGLMCRNNFMGKTDEAHFFIYNNEDRANPAGDICKKAAKSMLSIADNYSVVFPNKATFEEKILLTIAGIMIDYQYFEKNTNSK